MPQTFQEKRQELPPDADGGRFSFLTEFLENKIKVFPVWATFSYYITAIVFLNVYDDQKKKNAPETHITSMLASPQRFYKFLMTPTPTHFHPTATLPP